MSLFPPVFKKVYTSTIVDPAAFIALQDMDVPIDLFDACRDEGGIPVGVVPITPQSEAIKAIVFWCPTYLMNPHLAIIGATGAGKTTMLRTMIARYATLVGEGRASIIILDARREFTLLPEALGIGDVYRIKAEYRLSPFLGIGLDAGEIASNFTSMLLNLKILQAESTRQIAILQQALLELFSERVFLKDDLFSSNPGLPSVADLLQKVNEVAGTEDSVGRRSAQALIQRLRVIQRDFESGPRNVLNPFKIMFQPGIHVIDLSFLEEGPKKVAMYYFTFTMYLAIRMNLFRPTSGLDVNTILVIDEAHHVLGALRDPRNAEEQPLMKIIREGRHYGVAVWLSTQNPQDVPEHVLNNIGTVIIGKLGVRSTLIETLFGKKIAELVMDLQPLQFVVRMISNDIGDGRVMSGERVFIMKALPYFPPRGRFVSLLLDTSVEARRVFESITS